MANTQAKPQATQTELKNKLGMVLGIVDKEGFVVITSYGKEKYLITRVDSDHAQEMIDAELEAAHLLEQEDGETETTSEVIEAEASLEINIEQAQTSNNSSEQTTETQEPTGTIALKTTWDRANQREQDWISHTRDL